MSAVSFSDLSSEFESDERQLLVHQNSGNTIINIDHGMATYKAAAPPTGATSAPSHLHHYAPPPPTSARGSVTSSLDSCSLTSASAAAGGVATSASCHHNLASGSMTSSPSAAEAVAAAALSSSSSSSPPPPLPSTTTFPLTEEEVRRHRFDKLVRRAEDIDTATFVATTNNCMYVAGSDNQGRPVLVFIGKWFRSSEFDTEKAVMYLIKLLHHVVTSGQDYVVIYFHARTARENVPSYNWIKQVYTTLGYEYKKRLKAFYIVHPTVWTKMTCWYLSTFMAPAIKKKIHNVNALKELSSIGLGGAAMPADDGDDDVIGPRGGGGISSASMSIPMFIAEHDMSLNGLRYYRP